MIAALVCGFTAANVAGQPLERATPQTVTLGIISETNRAQIAEHFNSFVRYLASKLDPTSAIEGKVAIAPTPFQLAKLIEQKKVDFYMDSPYPTYLINDAHGVARLMLRRWKGGMAEYRSLIFTRRNGRNNSPGRPQGQTLRFRTSRIDVRTLPAEVFPESEGIQVYRQEPI